jgi:hypothetical protein
MRNVFDRTAAERERVTIANEEHARAEALFNDLAGIPKDDGDYPLAVAELPAANSAVRVTGAECVEANVALNRAHQTATNEIQAERLPGRKKRLQEYITALELAKRKGDDLTRYDLETCGLIDVGGLGAPIEPLALAALNRLDEWKLWLKAQGLI